MVVSLSKKEMPRFSSSCSCLIFSTFRYSETSDAATESSGGGTGSFSATDICRNSKQVSGRCGPIGPPAQIARLNRLVCEGDQRHEEAEDECTQEVGDRAP